jgi:ABC-2 type transport system ATP-binding protein
MPKGGNSALPRVGAIVEAPAAYGHLSGRANLALIDASRRSGNRRERVLRVGSALERVGLDNVGKRPVKAYSLGMRQRLGLAAALLRNPELLILDEPTNGLDPQGIREVRDLLLELNAHGTTVFMSSHLLAEIEQTCTRVGVIDRGRMVLQEDLDTLRRPTGCTIVRTPDVTAALALLEGRVQQHDGDRLVVRDQDVAALNAFLVGHGVRVTELGVERRSLEQIVIEATGPSNDRVSKQ